MKKFVLSLFSLFLLFGPITADEGMWLPFLLEKYTIEQMQQKGFKLSASDIYSINEACLKDGVVGLTRSNSFQHFCSGGLISNQGLFITNHHCGIGFVQNHSSVENDYLSNGFWAMRMEDELPNDNLAVSFLVRMEDVTSKIWDNIPANLNESERTKRIGELCLKIENEATEGTHYKANVKPFYSGNEFYLSVYEQFADVRLVGAPPQSIGKFGGDTDNWMWPRHTGDFCLFRIYAGADNKPANYSPDNKPYIPKKYFKINLKGVEKDDFTMVFGYPGTTTQYLTSFAVNLTQNFENPVRIQLRDIRLQTMNEYMEKDAKVRIQYTAKHAGIANGWKKWIGENKGLKRLKTIEIKQENEKAFQTWVNSSESISEEYGQILKELEKLYSQIKPLELSQEYIYEAGFAIEIVKFAGSFNGIISEPDPNKLSKLLEYQIKTTRTFFKNYHAPIDQSICSKLLQEWYDASLNQERPDFFSYIHKKYKNNFQQYANDIFNKTIFTDSTKLISMLTNWKEKNSKVISKDPVFKLFSSIDQFNNNFIYPPYQEIMSKIYPLQRKYVEAIREMDTSRIFYPDANSTFRIAFGKVDSYKPVDAVEYLHFTTLNGIIEKNNPEVIDYQVCPKLKALYDLKDYKPYSNTDQMPVCFIASNHTTGGNSGSPVLNANGELIGINFDRNWEGTMSDIMYDPSQCRNIVLDIRYALFIIDKYARASHLIKEMDMVY